MQCVNPSRPCLSGSQTHHRGGPRALHTWRPGWSGLAELTGGILRSKETHLSPTVSDVQQQFTLTIHDEKVVRDGSSRSNFSPLGPAGVLEPAAQNSTVRRRTGEVTGFLPELQGADFRAE